jgi:hypothetical protein
LEKSILVIGLKSESRKLAVFPDRVGFRVEVSQFPYVIHFVPAVFSSLSLGLLPERSATLMVYEDVVQIVSGFQGASQF